MTAVVLLAETISFTSLYLIDLTSVCARGKARLMLQRGGVSAIGGGLHNPCVCLAIMMDYLVGKVGAMMSSCVFAIGGVAVPLCLCV